LESFLLRWFKIPLLGGASSISIENLGLMPIDPKITSNQNSLNEEQFINSSHHLFVSAIESKLRMSYEARIESHENARQLIIDLQRAGEMLRAKPQRTS